LLVPITQIRVYHDARPTECQTYTAVRNITTNLIYFTQSEFSKLLCYYLSLSYPLSSRSRRLKDNKIITVLLTPRSLKHRSPSTDPPGCTMRYRPKHVAVFTCTEGADKSLARPGRKQSTAIEEFVFQISYL
jgi:hypothetical protein